MAPSPNCKSAAGVSGHGIPLELWDVSQPERRDARRRSARSRAITPSPGTTGVNFDPIRPAVFANSIAPRLGIEMPRVKSGTYRERNDHDFAVCNRSRQASAAAVGARPERLTVSNCNSEKRFPLALN